MCSMSSFTETTGFMSPHNAGCGAVGGGCDDFAEVQAELPADRAASVQATTIVRHRREGMYGENTTVVVQKFWSADLTFDSAQVTPSEVEGRRPALHRETLV